MSTSQRTRIRERFSRIEFAVVIFLVSVTLLLIGAAIPGVWAARQRQTCQANLKAIAVALSMYVDESEGERYPRQKLRDCGGDIQPWSGAIDLNGFYPEYLHDVDLLVCPAYPAGKSARDVWDEGKTTNSRWKAVSGFSGNGVVEPCEVLAKPYYYYGWTFSEAAFEPVPRERLRPAQGGRVAELEAWKQVEEKSTASRGQLERFRVAVDARAVKLAGGGLNEREAEWILEDADGNPLELFDRPNFPALRAGAERFYVPGMSHDWQAALARVVVLHEELFRSPEDFYHGAGRMNILYMDGHVESRDWLSKWPETFPLNEAGYILHEAVQGAVVQGASP